MKKKEILILLFLVLVLASIAVSNIAEMTIDEQVAKARADLRTIGIALESYRSDSGKYPPDSTHYQWNLHVLPPAMPLFRLTTPVAYLPSVPPEVFPPAGSPFVNLVPYKYHADAWIAMVYLGRPPATVRALHRWAMVSYGPDRVSNAGEYLIFGEDVLNSVLAGQNLTSRGCLYDATNGTISAGDIVRVSPIAVTSSGYWQQY